MFRDRLITYEFEKEAADPAVDQGLPSLKRDLLELGGLLAYTFVMVYYVGGFMADLLMLPLALLAYRSRYTYFWLVYLFVICDAPSRLFSANGLNDLRLPLYTLISGISVTFQELFSLAILVKFYFQGERRPNFFRMDLQIFYGLFALYFLSSFLIGISFSNVLTNLRILLPWFWLLLIPYYVADMNTLKRVSNLIFPFVFVALAAQIHTFLTGQYLDEILRGLESRTKLLQVTAERESASRAWSSVYLVLFSLIQGIFFYTSKTPFIKNKNYLSAVIFTAVITLFITATRGWIIAVVIILLGTTFLIRQAVNISSVLRLAMVSVLVVLVIGQIFPLIYVQLNASMNRFSTVLSLAEGDVTAGGTLKRLDVRGVRVLEKFYDSPVIGQAFSDTFHRFNDNHVGNHSLLLNVGILGYLIMVGLYLHICYSTWRVANSRAVAAIFGAAPKVYLFGLVAVFSIHTTTTQFWGYALGSDLLDKAMLFGILFACVNTIWLTGEGEKEAPASARARKSQQPISSPS